jgi:DNA recombination protein RmuC
MIIETLLGIILLLLVVLIFLNLKGKVSGINQENIENTISNTWMKSGIAEKIGAIETHANEIKQSYKSFEQLLRVPKERGSFGELSLETILSDSLPPDMYGIRERTLDGLFPDAHIKSTVGIICIDSKFPLDNYHNMLQTNDSHNKENYKKQFIKDVKSHLDKIALDYVCPYKGSAEFAFGYIPSEGVYYFLITEAFETLRDYTKKGVQVVSPLTLSQRIELIKAGVHAKKLSEDAEKVRGNLAKLSEKFLKVDEIWRIFYSTHFKNLEGKAVELDEAYRKLKDEFDEISEFSQD